MKSAHIKRLPALRTFAMAAVGVGMFAALMPLAGNAMSTSTHGKCKAQGDVFVKSDVLLTSDTHPSPNQTGLIPVTNLGKGDYVVNYTSYDDHSGHGGQGQTKEQWFFKVYSGDYVIYTSEATADIPEDVDYQNGSFGQITLPDNATAVQFVHSAPNSNNPESVYPVCLGFEAVQQPVTPACKSNGQVVIESGAHLIAPNSTVSQSYPINLEAGTYDSSYTSFDQHGVHGGQGQTGEQWYFKLFNGGGDEIYTSNPTNDIGEDTDYATGNFNQFTIDQAAASVVFYHANPTSSNWDSVYATCVGFTKVSQPSIVCNQIDITQSNRTDVTINVNSSTTDVSDVTYTFYVDGESVQSGSDKTFTGSFPTGNHTVKVEINSYEGETASCESTFVVAPANTASLGDYVWVDANKNGIQDEGEAPVSGVYVELLDASGNVIASTTTDENGYYFFDGLAPGDYKVKFTSPGGYTFTTQDSGDDSQDSDADPNSGMTGVISVGEGDEIRTVDAGLVADPVLTCNMIDVVSASRDNVSLKVDYESSNVDSTNFEWTVTYEDGSQDTVSTDGAEFTFAPKAPGSIKVSVSISGYDINAGCEKTIDLDGQVDLSLKKYVDVDGFQDANTSATAPSVEIGSEVNWKIVIKNDGPDTATNVEVSDILPEGAEFVKVVSITDGQSFDASSAVWSIDQIENGQSFELIIRTKLTTAGELVNFAGVTKVDQDDIDSVPGDIIDGNEDDEDPAMIKVNQTKVLGKTGGDTTKTPAIIPNTGSGSMMIGLAAIAMVTLVASRGYTILKSTK